MDFLPFSCDVPIVSTVDLCVIGGSCTGVFAAVRAARLGARVALVEKQNCFGGVATSGLVHLWHPLQDTEFKKEIIAGLTREILERLQSRNAVDFQPRNLHVAYRFNSEELKIELDRLVIESRVQPFLHASFTAPVMEEGRLSAIIIQTKSGLQAIKASCFIDATGDGDVAASAGIPFRLQQPLQPPTCCAKIQGTQGIKNEEIRRLYVEHCEEFGLAKDWGWNSLAQGSEDIVMHAETHVFNTDASDASALTLAEIEGRRQIRAFMDLFKKYAPLKGPISLVTLPSYIGVRQTRQFSCQMQLTQEQLLAGTRFDDAIANGSYPVDIHNSETGEALLRYLDGTEKRNRSGKSEMARWRPESKESPTFYQIPWRAQIPASGPGNLVLAGRMIDADPGAFGAIRVMVNCNQMGEAAGVAAVLTLDADSSFAAIAPVLLRQRLAEGGSIVL